MNQPSWNDCADGNIVRANSSPYMVLDSDDEDDAVGEVFVFDQKSHYRQALHSEGRAELMQVDENHAVSLETGDAFGGNERIEFVDDSDEFLEDMTPGGRYFLGAGEGNISNQQRCFNCGLSGHVSRDCPSKNVGLTF